MPTQAQYVKSSLYRACKYLRDTHGRTGTEGPRRILMEASKIVGTDIPGVDLTKTNIARRLDKKNTVVYYSESIT